MTTSTTVRCDIYSGKNGAFGACATTAIYTPANTVQYHLWQHTGNGIGYHELDITIVYSEIHATMRY